MPTRKSSDLSARSNVIPAKLAPAPEPGAGIHATIRTQLAQCRDCPPSCRRHVLEPAPAKAREHGGTLARNGAEGPLASRLEQVAGAAGKCAVHAAAKRLCYKLRICTTKEGRMAAQPTDRLPWPRFALTAIPYPPATPDAARRALDAAGVPVRCLGGEYIALEGAELLDEHPNLLAFGRSGLDGRVCLDAVSLEVVQVPVPGYPQINPVNSSLPAFIACVEAAISRFPYDSGEDESDDRRLNAAVRDLRERLLAIDPQAGAHNGLWETFLDDVANGDYVRWEFEPPESAE